MIGLGQNADFDFYIPTDGDFVENLPWEPNFHNMPSTIDPDSIHGEMYTDFGVFNISGCIKYHNTTPKKLHELCITDGSSLNICQTFTLDVYDRYSTRSGTGMVLIFPINEIDSFFYNSLDECTTVVKRSDSDYERFEYTYDTNGDMIMIEHFNSSTSTTPIQTDILTYNNSNQLTGIEVMGIYDFYYHYNSLNGLYAVTYYSNGLFVDTIALYSFNANGLIVNDEIRNYNFTNSLQENIKNEYTYNSSNTKLITIADYKLNGTSWVPYEGITNFSFNTNCTPVTQVNEISGSGKKLIRITNILGKETSYIKNQPLLYIYDDGTVEKRIVIEQ